MKNTETSNKKIRSPHGESKGQKLPHTRTICCSFYTSGVADPQRIIAVGNRELISCFRNASIWFGDGTFSVVPEMYFQLYMVHTTIENNYPPCVYFLLPNKTQETYRRMFNILRDLVPNAWPRHYTTRFWTCFTQRSRIFFLGQKSTDVFSICVKVCIGSW